MKPSIKLKMDGISGVLKYSSETQEVSIPAEFTGDYHTGILLFVSDIEQQITGPGPEKTKSRLLRDLQAWSKTSGTKLTW
jgi:hypothetical protein